MPVAPVLPARHARDNSAPAGLLARDAASAADPRLLAQPRNGLGGPFVAYSCGGSRGLAGRGPVSRVPVSALAGHRRMARSYNGFVGGVKVAA